MKAEQMAYYNDTFLRQAGPVARSAAQAADWLAGFAENMVRRRIERTTREELRALPLRDLDDLGIAPADIPYIAKEAARKAPL